jgi:NADPH:quinone reductase-like Zn-dependent oxidoreductase
VAGALYVAPLAAYACVHAAAPRLGEVAVVSAAAGGVGSVAVRGEGTSSVARIDVLEQIVELVAAGELEIPIARTYPLSEVRAAYEQLAERKTHGKIVLIPGA